MHICITGAAGFVGSQLAYYLHKQGHSLILLDNLSYGYEDNLCFNGEKLETFYKEDITNDFSPLLKGVDVVFHFAAISALPVNQINGYESFRQNVAGFANVLELCRRAKTPKVVLASTSAIYENNDITPFKENDPINPHILYSVGKKHCEDIANAFIKTYGMDITILRFFNVYGPHHDFRRKSPPLIAYIIQCFLENKTPALHSDGEQKRDYVYVDDVCEMCKIIMTDPKAKNETFNICSNKTYSVKDIYSEVSKHFINILKPIYRDPKLLWDNYSELKIGYSIDPAIIEKETNKFSLGSYEKAAKILGWSPKISMEKGIKNTVEYAVNLK